MYYKVTKICEFCLCKAYISGTVQELHDEITFLLKNIHSLKLLFLTHLSVLTQLFLVKLSHVKHVFFLMETVK